MFTDKHQILETITSISRIITLTFKPDKTKIAIRDHNVVLCDPDICKYYGIKFAQGIDRYINGDSREDIYILNHVICNFIEWYVLPYKEKDMEIYKGLINMAKYLCVGLKKLQQTYETGNVVGALQYYIIVLMAVIEDRYSPDLLYNSGKSNRLSFLDDENENDMIYSTIFDIEKFRSFWTKNELKSLCDQFNKCFRNPDEKDNIVFYENDKHQNQKYISNSDNEMSIDGSEISNSKNEQTKNEQTIDTISNDTVDKNDNRNSFILPKPRSKNNAIVKGHLVGIGEILDTMDKRFTAMLNQSVKGSK